MEATPPAAARSGHSSDLPHDFKQEEESDEDEKKGKGRSIEELLEQLKQWEARALEAERIVEEECEKQNDWAEAVSKSELEMADLAETLRKKNEEHENLQAKHREWLEKYRKDLHVEQLNRSRDQEKVAEQEELILRLMGQQEIESKIMNRRPLTQGETMAMHWKFPQLKNEVDQLKRDIDEMKGKMGRLEFERDQLQIELRVARQAPGHEQTTALIESNAALRLELEKTTTKAEKEFTEAQLMINKLNMDNDDLLDRLREAEKKSKQHRHSNADDRPSSRTSGQVRVIEARLRELEDSNADLRREMERLIRKHKEQHEDSMRIIEKKAKENDDQLDTIEKLKDRCHRLQEERPRQRRSTPPAHSHNSRSSRPDADSSANRSHSSDNVNELKEAVKRLERELADCKRANGQLEADRNDLRASLRQKTNTSRIEGEAKESAKIFELQTNLDLSGTRNIQLGIALKELQERFEKEEKKTKEMPGICLQLEELTIEVEELKKSLAKSEKECKSLQVDLEDAREMNMQLVTSKPSKLLEELNAAKERIKDLENENRLIRPTCSKEKRARLEEGEKEKEKEPSPPQPAPPFVLQATIPKTTPAFNGITWKPAFGNSTRRH